VLKYVLEGTNDSFPGQPPQMLGATPPSGGSWLSPPVKTFFSGKEWRYCNTTGLFFLDSIHVYIGK
jgi:hypothetical protein